MFKCFDSIYGAQRVLASIREQRNSAYGGSHYGGGASTARLNLRGELESMHDGASVVGDMIPEEVGEEGEDKKFYSSVKVPPKKQSEQFEIAAKSEKKISGRRLGASFFSYFQHNHRIK